MLRIIFLFYHHDYREMKLFLKYHLTFRNTHRYAHIFTIHRKKKKKKKRQRHPRRKLYFEPIPGNNITDSLGSEKNKIPLIRGCNVTPWKRGGGLASTRFTRGYVISLDDNADRKISWAARHQT